MSKLLILLGSETDDNSTLRVISGARGVAVFTTQGIHNNTYGSHEELFASKTLDHQQAKELRDFLLREYPLEHDM